MSSVDTRQINRDSLFLLANVRLAGDPVDVMHRIKVRNLSAGGMMAEGSVSVARGMQVAVELRNVGWVPGSVAWRQDDRFGIAFDAEIDPLAVRGTSTSPTEYSAPRFTRTPIARDETDPRKLRNI